MATSEAEPVRADCLDDWFVRAVLPFAAAGVDFIRSGGIGGDLGVRLRLADAGPGLRQLVAEDAGGSFFADPALAGRTRLVLATAGGDLTLP